MKPALSAACAAFFLSMAAASAARAPGAPPANNADLLFQQGLFDQARAAYEVVPKSSPAYAAALRQLGAIALYQNHTAEAETLLAQAHSRSPSDMETLGLLAETKMREGKFAELTTLLRQLHRPERVAEFTLFGDAKPYRSAHQGTITVPFQQTDPIPIVLGKVNGLTGLFAIDTGAPEVILDPQFALAAHVDLPPPLTVATSQRRMVPFGRIRKLELAGSETDDVPTMLMSTMAFTRYARNKRIAGVIGTEFLSHFRTTIDYVHDRLVLEPHDASGVSRGAVAQIPFWYVGDHVLVAPGRLDKGPKQLFVINTGMTAAAFLAPDSTLRDAGVPVPTLPAPAPGHMPSAKFPIDQLSLGDLAEHKLTGLYGMFPPQLERAIGFHAGGIVGHSFFEPYTVTFDFVRMRIDVRK